MRAEKAEDGDEEEEPTNVPVMITRDMFLAEQAQRLALSKDEQRHHNLGVHFVKFKQPKDKDKARGGDPRGRNVKKYKSRRHKSNSDDEQNKKDE